MAFHTDSLTISCALDQDVFLQPSPCPCDGISPHTRRILFRKTEDVSFFSIHRCRFSLWLLRADFCLESRTRGIIRPSGLLLFNSSLHNLTMAHSRRFLFRVIDPKNNPTARPQATILSPWGTTPSGEAVSFIYMHRSFEMAYSRSRRYLFRVTDPEKQSYYQAFSQSPFPSR